MMKVALTSIRSPAFRLFFARGTLVLGNARVLEGDVGHVELGLVDQGIGNGDRVPLPGISTSGSKLTAMTGSTNRSMRMVDDRT